jgi:hypothetical protein
VRSGTERARAHALEYLDNVLTGEVHRLVLAVLDDRPPRERLESAGRLFGDIVAGRLETLQGILRRGRAADADGPLVAAALYAVHLARLVPLAANVHELARSAEEPFIRETARWVAARLSASGSA